MTHRVIFQTRTKSMEWLLSAMMLAWAATMSAPGDTLTLAPYIEFLRLGFSDTNLAIFYGSLGSIRAITLYQNGALDTGPTIRLVCSFVAAFTWLTMSSLVFIAYMRDSVPLSAICPTTFVLFFGELYTVGVAAVDRRTFRN